MKRFLLMLVICVSLFMIYTNNVKALVYSDTKHFTDNYITCSTGYDKCSDNLNIFQNLTTTSTTPSITGVVNFSFVSDPQIIINSVTLTNSNNDEFTCSLGSATIYSDNTTGYNFFSANCPISLTKFGVIKINFYYDDQYYSGSSFKFFINDNYSFYTDIDDIDYRTYFNNLTQSIVDLSNNLGSKINNTNTIATNIYNQLVGSNSKLEDIKNKLDSLNSAGTNISNNTEEIKNDIKSDNVSGAESSADDLKNNSAFQDNTGLSGVISMPLTFVNSLTNTCQPINLTIPYMDVDLTIPCMQSVITDKMPLLANLIKIIVNGFIVYRILLDIFQIIRNAKNPEDDRIEVLDL